MLIGLVKWFDTDKGFGVIGTPEEGDFFIHKSNFDNPITNVSAGTPVLFHKKFDEKNNRNTAIKCRSISHSGDWKFVLYYINKPDTIYIDTIQKFIGKSGNLYDRKEIQSLSLFDLSANHYFKNINERQLVNAIIDYFDNDLDSSLFTKYCKLIEDKTYRVFSKEKASNILSEIFVHFGDNINEEILFQIWKTQSFRYINHIEADDFEIPEYVLIKNRELIEPFDLVRIKTYSFGKEFCKKFINEELSNLNDLSIKNLLSKYELTKLLDEETQLDFQSTINDNLFNKIMNTLVHQIESLPTINNSSDLSKYERIKNLIPEKLESKLRLNILNKIQEKICDKYSSNFLIEEWVRGAIEQPSIEKIIDFSLKSEIDYKVLISILLKLDKNKRFLLLKNYSVTNGFENTFLLIDNPSFKT
jgi:cold shock CspA family protein